MRGALLHSHRRPLGAPSTAAAGSSSSRQPTAAWSVAHGRPTRPACAPVVRACSSSAMGDSRDGAQGHNQGASTSSSRHDNSTSLPQAASLRGCRDAELFESLRRNPYWSQPEHRGFDLLASGRMLLQALPQIYVILFGLDDSQQEGIYSLRAVGPDGMPQDTIIAFESKDDADRYACLLEVTMEPHTPHVYSIPAAELYDFCLERSYQCRLEANGTLMSPPDYNVGLTDWERASKLRSGSYAVLTLDPETATAPGADSLVRSGTQAAQAVRPGSTCTHQATGSGTLAVQQQQLGQDQLDAIRSQLETLLPRECESDSDEIAS